MRMTQEMKLLMALTEALGFDLEVIIDRKERKEEKHNAMEYNKGFGFPAKDRILTSTGPHGMLDIDEDGLYTSVLKVPTVDYKLTARHK
jgi:hypothetical protein